MDNILVENANRFMNEETRYNTMDKVIAVLGRTPADEDVIDFIKAHYDLDDEYDMNKVSDIIGMYKIDPEDYFDENGNLKG